MITYRQEQEKQVALYFAALLGNTKAESILIASKVTAAEDARCLAQFFWQAVNKSADIKLNSQPWPFSESGEFWMEKLYNSIGGHLEKAGYEEIWNDEVDKA